MPGTTGRAKAIMYALRRLWSACRKAQAMAAGCGVESTVTVATRSGCREARTQARAPPQSCPTTWIRSAPTSSASAMTSPTDSPIS